MTPVEVRKLKKAIEDYAEACVDFSWRGSLPPEDMKIAEHMLAISKSKLNAVIKKLANNSKESNHDL